MKLPTYILFTNEEGRQGILQKVFPHYIGEVLLRDSLPGDSWGNVAGYKITIIWGGNYFGNHMILAANMKQALENEMNQMASWYLSEVIGKDLEKFQRYAL